MNPSEPTPLQQWINRTAWMEGADLDTELRQAQDEGRDLTSVLPEFQRLLAVPRGTASWFQAAGGGRDDAWIRAAQALVEKVQTLPTVADHPYHEPSDLAGIHGSRPEGYPIAAWTGDDEEWRSRLKGGLIGRICGCLLGKPIEGWRRRNIAAVSGQQSNRPIVDYFRPITKAEQAALAVQGVDAWLGEDRNSVLRGGIEAFEEDDDINYTTIGLAVVEQFGAGFKPMDVAAVWCSNLPILHTCTAERVAYRNFVGNVLPPDSASYRNPYREWIGAQIRADFFGYANPGNSERAAEWAWRDASISHIKNGIYGEMWVAAMLAAAYTETDWLRVIRAGLAQIPAQCRLREDVERVMAFHADGVGYDQAVDAIHAQWDESKQHDWCHTNSNAQVVALGLLYGDGDYTRTIGCAVAAGFDTDCNGATCGSLWGVAHGAEAIPAHWVEPLNDRVRTGVAGYQDTSIQALAEKMFGVAKLHA